MAPTAMRVVAIVFILLGAAVSRTQSKAQQANSVIVKETESTDISCSAGELLVFTNYTESNGREKNDGCKRFIIGKINYHCRFHYKCNFNGHYSECLVEYSYFRLDYYCLRNDSFHRSCDKIRVRDEHGVFGILTSSSYPLTKNETVCSYQFLVPPEHKVHLTVFDCYFASEIQDKSCSPFTSVPQNFKLPNASIVRINEKHDNYAGFLALYVVEDIRRTKTRLSTKKQWTTTTFFQSQVSTTKTVSSTGDRFSVKPTERILPKSTSLSQRATQGHVPGKITRSVTVNSAQTSKIKVSTAMYSVSEKNESDQVPKKTAGIGMIAGVCIAGVLLIVGGIVGGCCYYKRIKRTDLRRKPAMRDITNVPQKNSDCKKAQEHEMYATINDVDAASAEGKTRNGEKKAGYAICSAHESVPYANMSASDPAMPVYAEVNNLRKLNEMNDSVKSEKTPGEITYADVVICNQGDGNAKKGVVGEYQHAGETVYAEIQK